MWLFVIKTGEEIKAFFLFRILLQVQNKDWSVCSMTNSIHCEILRPDVPNILFINMGSTTSH